MNRVLLSLAVLMALLGAGCYALIAEVDTASCDRDVGTCTVTLAKLHRTSTQSFPVDELTGADLQSLPGPPPDDNTVDTTVRVVILTKQRPVPFMTYASAFGLAGMEADVNAVSSYAATSSVKRLDLRRDNRVYAALAASVPLLASAALLLFAVRLKRGARSG
jgi:hypothetical protein